MCVYDGKNKHNDKTGYAYAVVKHETFFSSVDGPEYGTSSNGFTGDCCLYYTMFIPQKLSNERTNYTCNWCGCHLASKIHLGYSLNIFLRLLLAQIHNVSNTLHFLHDSVYEAGILYTVCGGACVSRGRYIAKASKYQIYIYDTYTFTNES